MSLSSQKTRVRHFIHITYTHAPCATIMCNTIVRARESLMREPRQSDRAGRKPYRIGQSRRTPSRESLRSQPASRASFLPPMVAIDARDIRARLVHLPLAGTNSSMGSSLIRLAPIATVQIAPVAEAALRPAANGERTTRRTVGNLERHMGGATRGGPCVGSDTVCSAPDGALQAFGVPLLALSP